jgi:hypothetical protein
VKYATRVLLLVIATIAVYGFVSERLYAQPMWSPDGWHRLLLFAAGYWIAAAPIIALAPRWFGVAAGATFFIYTIWWAGPLAPLAVMFFLGSCYLLGRKLPGAVDGVTATVVGAAAWSPIIWVALHFPVNISFVWLIALAIPYVFWKDLRKIEWRCESRKSALALAPLIFILLAYGWMALKPEVSSDALAMHLMLPAAVGEHQRWGFDFRTYSWAVMPASVDGLYAIVYLLGGETAAKLLNFAFLALIAAMMVRLSRRWMSMEMGALSAALFVSTPLAALVTGSLFIENVWAAMILAAAATLLHYADSKEADDVAAIGLLLGAALASKLIAAANVLPIAVLTLLFAIRRKHLSSTAVAGVLLIAIGVIPYAYSWVVTGNPVFPFLNAVFHSPYYPDAKNFTDVRYLAPLSLKTGYAATFQSGSYMEGRGGAGGFQYFLLLVPAALLIRKRDQWMILAIGAIPAFIVLAALPNLRYLYGALPILSIVLAWVLVSLPRIAAVSIAVLLAALNLWFLPAADPYDLDFALFSKAEISKYIERMAPTRLLVDHLRDAAGSEPVALFGTDSVAGLPGLSYADSWHSEPYWLRVRDSPSPEAIAAIFRELRIRHVIAPLDHHATYPALRVFLKRWLAADGPTAGPFGVYRVLDSALPEERDMTPLSKGTYEDAEARIDYVGTWWNDRQFSQAGGGSLTYSDATGDHFSLNFDGASITYFYTKALNRGIAAIWIDGREKGEINQFSGATQWQRFTTFSNLGKGKHTFEVRVTGRRDPRSTGHYVDLDKVEIQ